MTAIRLGFASSLTRLSTRGAVVALALIVALALTSGAIEAGSPDRALYLTYRFLVPLGVFVAVGAGTRGDLRRGSWGVARLGASRVSVVVGQLGAVAAVSVALSLLVTWVALVCGHGLRAGLAQDLVTSSWIAVLAALAYVTLFGLAATFGRGRGPLGAVFFFDFFLGQAGVFGAILPRGHVAGLLGFEPPLGLSQRQSSVALVAMIFLFGATLVFRARDRRARAR